MTLTKAILITITLVLLANASNLQSDATLTLCSSSLYKLLSKPTGQLNITQSSLDFYKTIQSSTLPAQVLARMSVYPPSYVATIFNLTQGFYLQSKLTSATSCLGSNLPSIYCFDTCTSLQVNAESVLSAKPGAPFSLNTTMYPTVPTQINPFKINPFTANITSTASCPPPVPMLDFYAVNTQKGLSNVCD